MKLSVSLSVLLALVTLVQAQDTHHHKKPSSAADFTKDDPTQQSCASCFAPFYSQYLQYDYVCNYDHVCAWESCDDQRTGIDCVDKNHNPVLSPLCAAWATMTIAPWIGRIKCWETNSLGKIVRKSSCASVGPTICKDCLKLVKPIPKEDISEPAS